MKETKIELTEDQRNNLVNALRVGAERFLEHKKLMEESNLHPTTKKALSSQFERQAQVALEQAELFENAESMVIVLGDMSK